MRFTTDDVIALALAAWFTVLCGGFAYLYWVVGFVDPRTLGAPELLTDLGALMVFPVGWIGLLIFAIWGD